MADKVLNADNVEMLEQAAEGLIDAVSFGYIKSAAGDSSAVNRVAWDNLRLRPRMLRDVTSVSTEVELLGQMHASPVMIAPTAMHRLVHENGELDTARGAATADAVYVMSMAATQSVEDVAAAAPDSTLWMQLYMRRDRGITRELCARAADAGCKAMVLTVDASVIRSDRPDLDTSLNQGMDLPNLAPGVESPDIYDLGCDYATDLVFADLSDIREWSGLPLVVKGVVRGDDAKACADAGVDAIAVSNHGGRQVGGCISTAEALAGVVASVGSDIELYVDGGIETGSDIVRALSLGATAVMVGRPVLWALAVGGAPGVAEWLESLRVDLERTMALCGATNLASLTPDLLV